jgi:ribosome-binding factor A
MGPEQGTRARRVGEAVREELALLLSADVKDPGAAGAVVTRVEMASDLRCARVLVRLLDGGADPKRRALLIKALGRASGMMRRVLTQRLGLRFAPDLAFSYDDGLDNTTRIEEILAEIDAERAGSAKR